MLDAVEALEERWGEQLQGTRVSVEDVPPDDQAGLDRIVLAKSWPAAAGESARIVVYRRPLELRARSTGELGDFVYAVLVEQVAELLGKHPEEIDPGFG